MRGLLTGAALLEGASLPWPLSPRPVLRCAGGPGFALLGFPGSPRPPAPPARGTGVSPASLGRSRSSGCGPCGGAAGDSVQASGLSLRRPAPSVAGTHLRRDPLSGSCSAGGARWASVCFGVPLGDGHHPSRPPRRAKEEAWRWAVSSPFPVRPPRQQRTPCGARPHGGPRGGGFVNPLAR